MHAEEVTSQVPLRGHASIALRHFGTGSGLMVARSVLGGRTYPAVPFVQDVATVLDVGANLGAASIFFSSLYPSAKVFALEPAGAPFELLRENTTAWPNVVTLRHGLSSLRRTAMLHHSAHDSVEASVRRSIRSSDGSEEIELHDVGEFLSRHGIGAVDVLKLDTEGAETEVLGAFGSRVRFVKLLYVEYHSERDRLWIDQRMSETHVLWRARVDLVYRGEFCYLRRDLIPEDASKLSPELDT